jgi:hypothetical protein
MSIGNPDNENVYKPASGEEREIFAAVTGGTVSAGKVLAVDSNKDLSSLRTLTLGGFVFNDIGTVAAAGANQGNATAITNKVTYVTAADGTKGVVLPAASAGLVYVLYTTVATNGLNVYPASGDDINDGSADAAVVMEGKTAAIFIALDSSTWAAIFTANS